MPVFSYVTKDFQGNVHRGEIETVDSRSAASLLRKKKLIIIGLKVKNDSLEHFASAVFQRVSFNDIVILTRQLATMIGAGLVLSEAIDLVTAEQVNPRLKRTMEQISADIKGGSDFASALEKHSDVFPRLYINLVKAGEASGKLDVILLQLANYMERQREFQSKVQGAMIYPIVVIFMMIAVMLVMVFFVMPRLLSLYKQSSIELPLPTKILIGSTTFMLSYWWAMLILVILIVASLRYWLKTPQGKREVDKRLLRLPILGRVISVVIMTNFTRTFGLLISAGIPILEAIKISQDVVGNESYKETLRMSYLGVERGLPFSSQLASSQSSFPRIVSQMVRTGEETGKLDEVLSKLADYFQSEADNSLKNVTTLIEPLILVVLGVGVAFLVLSIILPIYQLTTSIG